MQESVKLIFEELIKSNHPESISLIVAISRFLKQYHLQDLYSVSDVVNEAYCRAYQACKKREFISNPRAWIRATAHNIVREYKRKASKHITIDQNFLETIKNPEKESFAEDFYAIYKASIDCFNMLNEEQQLIFSLRVFKNLTWEQVREELVKKGYKERKVSTLRKSYERLLRRLRTDIHKLLPQEVLSGK
jgi:RNA polymerase sigma factor (sigma-70 family)